MQIQFRPVCEDDVEAIRQIYTYYILNTTVTFHIRPISKDEMKAILNLGDPFYRSFTIRSGDELYGYALFTRFGTREAFSPSAEVTIYLKPDCTGRGIGSKALRYIEKAAKASGIHTLLALITGDNIPSLRIFEKNGYLKCGYYKEVGLKFGRKLDLAVCQKILGYD